MTTPNEPVFHRWQEPEREGCFLMPKAPPAARADAPKPGDVLDAYGPFPGPDGVDWWAYCRPTPEPIFKAYAGRVTVFDDRLPLLWDGDQA